MNLTTQIRLAAFGLATALLLAACGKSDEADNAFADADSILRYVPADTPYILARLEPLPGGFRERMQAHNEIARQQNRALFEKLIESHADDEALASPDARNALEMIRRIMDLTSAEGLESVGIEADGQFAAYGYGLLPVLRFELSDPVAWREFVVALAADIGLSLQSATLGSSEYDFVDLGQVRWLHLIDGSQAVSALAERDASDDEIAARLGLDLPRNNIAQAGTLAEVISTYGFIDSSLGYLDMTRLVDELVIAAAALDAGAGKPQIAPMFDEACRRDIKRLVAAMPRTVAGIRSADEGGIASSTIIELREDIAKDLSGLAAPVPGLGSLQAEFASFGMSFDAKVARAFVEKRVQSVVESPFECRFLTGYNSAAAKTAEFLERQPLPPTAYDFKGFVIALDSIEGLGAKPADFSASFRALIAINNAESVMALGNMFVPEIAALNLKPNGDIVKLSTERLGDTQLDAWISMTKNAIGLASGAGGEQQLQKLMSLKPNDEAPLLHADIDAASYLSLVRQGMSMNAADSTDAEILSSVSSILDSLAELYDRFVVDVVTTEHGIELRSDVSLRPE